MKDIDKLIVIAQTYSYLKGSFTANQLYNFIQSSNFKFHTTGFSSIQIGRRLSRSSKFLVEEGKPARYEAI